jgi:hypothetical protein
VWICSRDPVVLQDITNHEKHYALSLLPFILGRIVKVKTETHNLFAVITEVVQLITTWA